MSQRADLDRCSEVLDRLDAWIDGDIDTSEADAIAAHVDCCQSCQTAKRDAEELIIALRSLPEFDIPDRVVRSARNRATPSLVSRAGEAWRGSIFRPMPALAAVATVVLLVVVFSPWRGPTTPQLVDHEITRATEETKLALALVGSVTRKAELSVAESILEDGVAAQTVRGINRSLQIIGGAATAAAGVPATPLPH
jgi:anti-sigma factor RsiW